MAVPVAGIYEGSKFAVEDIAQALAAKVASFGIRVTISEPGPYATNVLSNSSIKQAAPNPVYAPARQHLAAMLTPDMIGNPTATVAAILKLVDAKEPPLRLILGFLLPMIRQVYADRIKAWEDV
jgi:NAD(P)-dependent dehydrogenase (short-subunit alcohol dehydrogenase family)